MFRKEMFIRFTARVLLGRVHFMSVLLCLLVLTVGCRI